MIKQYSFKKPIFGTRVKTFHLEYLEPEQQIYKDIAIIMNCFIEIQLFSIHR